MRLTIYSRHFYLIQTSINYLSNQQSYLAVGRFFQSAYFPGDALVHQQYPSSSVMSGFFGNTLLLRQFPASSVLPHFVGNSLTSLAKARCLGQQPISSDTPRFFGDSPFLRHRPASLATDRFFGCNPFLRQ